MSRPCHLVTRRSNCKSPNSQVLKLSAGPGSPPGCSEGSTRSAPADPKARMAPSCGRRWRALFPRSTANPVLPTCRCCVRSFPAAFQQLYRPPGWQGMGPAALPQQGREESGPYFPPRQSSAACFKLDCLRGGKNRLAKGCFYFVLFFSPDLSDVFACFASS